MKARDAANERRDRPRLAFAVAREQGPTTATKLPLRDLNLDTKQSSHYTDVDSQRFHRRADAFITAAVHSPHVKLHRQSQQWWLGDFDREPLDAETILGSLSDEARKEEERKKS